MSRFSRVGFNRSALSVETPENTAEAFLATAAGRIVGGEVSAKFPTVTEENFLAVEDYQRGRLAFHRAGSAESLADAFEAANAFAGAWPKNRIVRAAAKLLDIRLTATED